MKYILTLLLILNFHFLYAQNNITYLENWFDKPEDSISIEAAKYGYKTIKSTTIKSFIDSTTTDGATGTYRRIANNQTKWIKSKNNYITMYRTWENATLYNKYNNDSIRNIKFLNKIVRLNTTNWNITSSILKTLKSEKYKKLSAKKLEEKYQTKSLNITYKKQMLMSGTVVYSFNLEEKKPKFTYTPLDE